MKTQEKTPPANAQRVYRWSDLPRAIDPATFRVVDEGQDARNITVSNHQRQVLEALMQRPLYAASYCRLSDQVLPLRRDHGVDIECEMYRNDPETGRQRYGIYFLKSHVTRAVDVEMAA